MMCKHGRTSFLWFGNCLSRVDPVANMDRSAAQDMGTNSSRASQAVEWTGTGEIFEVVAGRAHADAFAEDAANIELLADER
jgi:hypothetical protein